MSVPHRSRWLRWMGIPLLALALLALGLWPLVGSGFAFLRRMEAPETPSQGFTVEDHPVPLAEGSLPADLYRPAGRIRRVVVLAHGVHHLGRKEPRLQRYARELARAGSVVLVPDLPDLMAYELSPRTVDHLEAAVLALAALPAPERRPRKVQLHGISFAGGLSLCAASRPSLKDKVGGVFAFGAQGDLDAVLRFLASGTGSPVPPHPYGQAVVLRIVAPRLLPEAEVEPFRAALLAFLQDRPEVFRRAVAALPEASRRLATLCAEGKSQAVADLLRPLAPTLHGDPALSPLHQPPPSCPVFLLHGAGDAVIPASETQALAAWSRNSAPTCWLISDRISHVELQKSPRGLSRLLGTFRLLRFWTALLRV